MILDDENSISENVEGPAETEAKVAAPSRHRVSYDADSGGLVSLHDGETHLATYSMSSLPPVSVDWLARRGLAAFLLVPGRSHADAFARLMKGDIPAAKSKQIRISPWREAIAFGLVDATKKNPTPHTIDMARTVAAGLTPDQVRNHKTDASVVKHFNRLTNKPAGGLLSLVPAELEAEAA